MGICSNILSIKAGKEANMPETHKSDFQYLVSGEIGESWGVFTIGSILKSLH